MALISNGFIPPADTCLTGRAGGVETLEGVLLLLSLSNVLDLPLTAAAAVVESFRVGNDPPLSAGALLSNVSFICGFCPLCFRGSLDPRAAFICKPRVSKWASNLGSGSFFFCSFFLLTPFDLEPLSLSLSDAELALELLELLRDDALLRDVLRDDLLRDLDREAEDSLPLTVGLRGRFVVLGGIGDPFFSGGATLVFFGSDGTGGGGGAGGCGTGEGNDFLSGGLVTFGGV